MALAPDLADHLRSVRGGALNAADKKRKGGSKKRKASGGGAQQGSRKKTTYRVDRKVFLAHKEDDSDPEIWVGKIVKSTSGGDGGRTVTVHTSDDRNWIYDSIQVHLTEGSARQSVERIWGPGSAAKITLK